MEIYNDILSAINLDLNNGEVKPTRVQSISNLAYDKLVLYLNELEMKKNDPAKSSSDNRERSGFPARL